MVLIHFFEFAILNKPLWHTGEFVPRNQHIKRNFLLW